jgi:hypothetical protein
MIFIVSRRLVITCVRFSAAPPASSLIVALFLSLPVPDAIPEGAIGIACIDRGRVDAAMAEVRGNGL